MSQRFLKDGLSDFSNRMALCIPTMGYPEWQSGPDTWNPLATDGPYRQYIANYREVGGTYGTRINQCWREAAEPILGFVHDDLYMQEQGWDTRILRQFDDPEVGVVGVAGGMRHGMPDLYDGPFVHDRMARWYFRSNLTNAEDHGFRFTGECDAAVLDMMAVWVRRDLIDKLGGWPDDGVCLTDYWISCEARRHGYRIRLVGLQCRHAESQGNAYARSLGLPAPDSVEGNRRIWAEYRDVLPYEVPKEKW